MDMIPNPQSLCNGQLISPQQYQTDLDM